MKDENRPGPLAAEPAPGRWRLVGLVPADGREPCCGSEAHAEAVWAVRSAPWHPAVLVESAALPLLENADYPSAPEPDQIRIVAAGCHDRLPSGHDTQAADAGAILLEATADRLALVREILGRVTGRDASEVETDSVALDFLALGTARWWLRDLTIAMGHADRLDIENLTREVLAGARAWRDGDRTATTGRLRAAFELLTQARERFYPVDAYVLDLCLLDPSLPAGVLAGPLDAHAPMTFIAPARAIAMQAAHDPDGLARLRAAIEEGWVDVVGGAYGEADEPLRPLESVCWQLRKGHETYRAHLGDRAVESFARRRFGLYPQLPQVAKRFGFRYALHWGLDAGRFPVPPETKRLWEAPDGSFLEALTRPPIAADRAAGGLQLPWRLGRSMKDDHVAAIPMVHWPEPVADWFRDYRRVARYSPVLARWVTVNDFFHRTDRPWEMFRPPADDYRLPYLDQAVARREPAPISRRAIQAGLRARLDAVNGLRALARVLGGADAGPGAGRPDAAAIEDAAESGRFDEARAGLDAIEPHLVDAVVRAVLGVGTPGAKPGLLVLNPTGVARTTPVLLPDAAADLRPGGPLRAAQLVGEGVWGIVELPAFGFAWVPRVSDPELPPPPAGALGVVNQVLHNERMEVEIDANTGGIRGLRARDEAFVRVGQQLAIFGLGGPDAQPASSRMRGEGFEVEYAGPALVQAWTEGTLRDPTDDRTLARFRQRFRLWASRAFLELDIGLSELDPSWVASLADSDPWRQYLACRWAWPDDDAELRRTVHLHPTETGAVRPETPDVFDLTTRRQRTALVFGGLAHHRRHGARMLDTLLVAGRETARRFRLGVALDQEYPFHAATEFLAPAPVVPTDAGPPATGPAGWFFQLDSRSVAVTRVEPLENSGDGRGWGVAFHLLETAGRPARCRLRPATNPVWARQTDFLGELIVDLSIDGDAVNIDLTPHELARVDVTLGGPPA